MRARRALAVALLAAVLPLSHTAATTLPPASMTPRTRDVTLRVGQRVSLPYVATFGPSARTTDVVFVVDTSSWADPGTFEITREAISRAARALWRRPGTRIGLAEYRDLGDADLEGQATYRLRHRLSGPSAAFDAALRALTTSPVSHPHGEAATVALHEVLYGDGHLGVVPPGQDAGFAKDHYQVAVLVTDSPIAQLVPDVYPSIEDVWWDLHDLAVVGLLPWSTTRVPAATRAQVAEFAWWGPSRAVACGTGSSAPVEAHRVEPMLCDPRVDPADPDGSAGRVATVATNLVTAVGRWTLPSGIAPAGMTTDHDADGRPLYPVTTDTAGHSDPARTFRLPFHVGLRCPNGSRGKTFTVRLDAHRGLDDHKGLATIRLRCR